MTYQITLICSEDDAEMNRLRTCLRKTMLNLSLLPHWKEVYPELEAVPATGKGKKLPLLIVNDTLVWWAADGEQPVSSPETMQQLLLQNPVRKRLWKKKVRTHLSFLMAVLIAFFPKCPFCWVAYMSLFSAFGMETIPYQPWLLPFLIGLLFMNILSLYLSGKKYGYKPLALAVLGAVVITLNRLYWNEKVFIFIGGFLLISASIWNNMPKRIIISLHYYFKGMIKKVENTEEIRYTAD